ncbi:unnamed protein product [Dicrocoelium dendriticum]|nr:unnamed protein product [Dicrocoelium dendriticum]
MSKFANFISTFKGRLSRRSVAQPGDSTPQSSTEAVDNPKNAVTDVDTNHTDFTTQCGEGGIGKPDAETQCEDGSRPKTCETESNTAPDKHSTSEYVVEANEDNVEPKPDSMDQTGMNEGQKAMQT